MLYRPYGKTGEILSAISFGTTRLNAADLCSREGLERCASLMVEAAKLGVNNFDLAHNYAKGKCEEIYSIAKSQITTPHYISVKSSSFQDNTADAVLRRIEHSIASLGVEKVDFLYMWSIMHQEHYQDIMKKGGAYEGAVKAKARGLVEHIVFSSHAAPPVAINIIAQGAFEGVTISYNMLNFAMMDEVIAAAAEKGMGIAVMNPLAGGLIPQNEAFFARLKQQGDQTVSESALRFVYAHPEITTILSGISGSGEIAQNIKSVETDGQAPAQRICATSQSLKRMEGLCTGCGYCAGCPAGIPIAAYMQAYNMQYFAGTGTAYGRSDPQLLKRIAVMKKLKLDFQMLPHNAENPCLNCGRCEKLCTQHLPITAQLSQLFWWAEESAFSLAAYRARLAQLVHEKQHSKVGFYTAGGYTGAVIDYYKAFFGEPNFEIVIFDSNPARVGEKLLGYPIYAPDDIEQVKPGCIVISNYNFDEEIFSSLKKYAAQGIEVLKLHEPDDVPWVF